MIGPRPPTVDPARQKRLKRTITRLLDRAHEDAERVVHRALRLVLNANGQINPFLLPPAGGGETPTGTYLVSGGQVTWQSGYTYVVASGTGYINGTLVSWAQQTITLDAAHATLDRLDVIGVANTSTVFKATGTAAANPSEPVVDPATQLYLSLVEVNANTTQPTVSSELVYAENAGSGGAPAEWNWTTSGTGWTLASTSNPRTGTVAIAGTNVAVDAYVQGQRGSGTIDPTTFSQLVIYLRFAAVWGTNRYLQVTLRNAGVQVGNALRVSSGFFGLDGANTTTYQAVIIPTLQFAAPAGSLVDQVRIQALGTGGTAIAVRLDDISFTSGGTTVIGGGGLTQDEADARYARRANNLSDLQSAATARTNLGLNQLAVREVDGTPTETEPTALEFPNGTLTEPSAGVVRYTPVAGADLSGATFVTRTAHAGLSAEVLLSQVAASELKTRWELVVDGSTPDLIWAGPAGSLELIYAEVPVT